VPGQLPQNLPRRPYEVCRPGDRFVTVDISERGRIGLSICYDTWFPELARQLARLGAGLIMAPTLTPTSDRPQELVLTHATAIINQVYLVSVYGAAPCGTGRSLIVESRGDRPAPGGRRRHRHQRRLGLDAVSRVHRFGTVGLNRRWEQIGPGDRALERPLYQEGIGPGHLVAAPSR